MLSTTAEKEDFGDDKYSLLQRESLVTNLHIFVIEVNIFYLFFFKKINIFVLQ